MIAISLKEPHSGVLVVPMVIDIDGMPVCVARGMRIAFMGDDTEPSFSRQKDWDEAAHILAAMQGRSRL